MNKSESKYFNTALKMDNAFFELLEKKDFEYITVKEICEKAGVNRSTFYLHYDSTVDILEECYEYAIQRLYSYFESNNENSNGKTYLLTPEYLIPYLRYVRDNAVIFKTVAEHQTLFNTKREFEKIFENVFSPILSNFNISPEKQMYIVLFYLNGIYAVISRWIGNGFKESEEEIAGIICMCSSPVNDEN